jgi:predicted metal-dependent hydrolase
MKALRVSHPVADPATMLKRRVSHWCIRLKLNPRIVRVQKMTRKWGSCSTKGIVTLAYDLPDQPEPFQDFVIVHELLHLRVQSHNRLFKALMTTYVPEWREMEASTYKKRSP